MDSRRPRTGSQVAALIVLLVIVAVVSWLSVAAPFSRSQPGPTGAGVNEAQATANNPREVRMNDDIPANRPDVITEGPTGSQTSPSTPEPTNAPPPHDDDSASHPEEEPAERLPDRTLTIHLVMPDGSPPESGCTWFFGWTHNSGEYPSVVSYMDDEGGAVKELQIPATLKEITLEVSTLDYSSGEKNRWQVPGGPLPVLRVQLIRDAGVRVLRVLVYMPDGSVPPFPVPIEVRTAAADRADDRVLHLVAAVATPLGRESQTRLDEDDSGAFSVRIRGADGPAVNGAVVSGTAEVVLTLPEGLYVPLRIVERPSSRQQWDSSLVSPARPDHDGRYWVTNGEELTAGFSVGFRSGNWAERTVLTVLDTEALAADGGVVTIPARGDLVRFIVGPAPQGADLFFYCESVRELPGVRLALRSEQRALLHSDGDTDVYEWLEAGTWSVEVAHDDGVWARFSMEVADTGFGDDPDRILDQFLERIPARRIDPPPDVFDDDDE